ncbi:MAG: selenocysteine lyase/cysteine desulfurase [Rhodothermales bacterium]|jgi:selenocysteine lyase/cysteine desulfurase
MSMHMNRRDFVGTGLAASIGAAAPKWMGKTGINVTSEDFRSQFRRGGSRTYLNAAGMMPLGDFSRAGLKRFMEYQAGSEDQLEYTREVRSGVRELFAGLVGAAETEIGLVHCTKAGEQIALDGLAHEFARGRGILTNDLHFAGSLNNLMGMKRTGVNVKVVRSQDWAVPADLLIEAMDSSTALVAVSLVSNINGHVEDIRRITDAAHAHGALVYADIIQAAGIVPLDLSESGIDVAACSCYKWLYGVHGTGFVYVRKDIQGARLRDKLFPGQARHNYQPWISSPDSAADALLYQAPTDATRYQPGHPSYLGYCASYEGMKKLLEVGVEAAQAHSARLGQRLRDNLDADRYRCISPTASHISTFILDNPAAARKAVSEANVVTSLSGSRLRVSTALFNTDEDVDQLADVLRTA